MSTDQMRQPFSLRVTAIGCLLTILLAVQFAVLYFVMYLFQLVTYRDLAPSLPWVLHLGFPTVLVLSALWIAVRARRRDTSGDTAGLLGGGLVVLALSSVTANGGCEVSSGGLLASAPTVAWDWHWYWIVFDLEMPAIGLQSASGNCDMLVGTVPLFAGYVLLATGLWLDDGLDRGIEWLLSAVPSTAPTTRRQ
jgi:hypothetical protein